MTIILDFEFFDTVYLKTDTEQRERMIVEIRIQPGNLAVYTLQQGTTTSEHYREELSVDKNEAKAFE